mmetsp:Transcript_91732/g.163266  ORF Transcript_91732/g.163266 Transcript_91732/m.163266 type:complete len:209 (-) Transcript_91732:25-651(-)
MSPLPSGHPIQLHKSRSAPAVAAPGPGHYSPEKLRFSSDLPKGSFTRSRRWENPQTYQKKEPGPGDFQKTQAQDRLWSNHTGKIRRVTPFATAARKLISVDPSGPGPADYEPSKPVRTAQPGSFSRSSRFKEEELAQTRGPGPATYHKTQAELGKLWSQPKQPYFSVVPRRCVPGVPEPTEAPPSQVHKVTETVLFSGLVIDQVVDTA